MSTLSGSWHYTIEFQCDKCGRFEQMYRGTWAAKTMAASAAKRKGWDYNHTTKVAVCPQCVKEKS